MSNNPVQDLAGMASSLGQPDTGGVDPRGTRIAETTTVRGDAGEASVTCTTGQINGRDATMVDVTLRPNTGRVEAGVVPYIAIPQGGGTVNITGGSPTTGIGVGSNAIWGRSSVIITTGGVTIGSLDGTSFVLPTATNCSPLAPESRGSGR
jgi:hypothetical protein